MKWKLAIAYLAAALLVIGIVDYIMGERAQALNGYEIFRRTFIEPLGVDAPVRSDLFIIKQESFGSFALVWAWFLYLLWASILARFLYAATKRIFKKKKSVEETFFDQEE
jgi:hypothetical protein